MNYRIFDNRIEYIENGEILGEINFEEIKKGIFDINHTFVNEKLRGKGIGKKLVELAKKEIEKRNGKILASCSYAKKILESEK
ncbi:MAG: N-acetyltransferase [Bacilli bacterium]|nr:N-acetyltransferase [Bacilli bacterium]